MLSHGYAPNSIFLSAVIAIVIKSKKINSEPFKYTAIALINLLSKVPDFWSSITMY